MKKLQKLALAAGFALATAFTLGCSSDDGDGGSGNGNGKGSGTFTDSRDGTTYKYVTIGTQVWMAEDLRYNAEGSKECTFSNRCDDLKCREYNHETAMSVCPSDWHLPNNDEWSILVKYIDPSALRDGLASYAGEKFKAKDGCWKTLAETSNFIINILNNGTDDYGFSALPPGVWWAYDNDDDNEATVRGGLYTTSTGIMSFNGQDKSEFFPVRCIKD